MSQWSQSEYKGPKQLDWEEGVGRFTFPNGVVYEGNFLKGEFHGEGTLIYPNGVSLNCLTIQGRYVAKWDRGKLLDGNYFFFDKLEFQEPKAWNYCTFQDRRFYTEVATNNLRPEGQTLITNDDLTRNPVGPERIPEGTYDIGDGFYDPLKRIICKYDGQFARELH